MNETRREILDALSEGPVSGPELADRLGVSRAAVWKQIDALRDDGFDIDGDRSGYRLASVPDYGGDAIEYGLDAPFEIEYHDAVGSTNDRARALASDGRTDVVVVSGEQTGGRGRLDRDWASPPGGVYLSIVVRPELPPAHAPLVTLAAAVATTEAVREAGVPAGIKWPNDVLVQSQSDSDGTAAGRGGRKLAGVLTEMEGEADRVSWIVVGIGLNANVDAEELPDGSTSLRSETGSVDRRVLVQRILERFASLRDDPDAILDRWREHGFTLGQRVRVTTRSDEIVGTAVGIESPGTLVLDTDSGRVRVHAGDCEHLRRTGD